MKKEIGLLLGMGVAIAVIFGPLWWRPAVPCVAGDPPARAQSRVPDEWKAVYLDAQQMKFGFGSAAIGGWDSLGDAVVVGGQAWLRTTHAHSPKYFSTVANRYFQSNGFFYLPPERASASSRRIGHSTPLQELWDALAGSYPEGVMVSGYVRLAPLRLIAMSRPAIDRLPVRQNAPRYFTRPLESAPEAWVYVVGLAVARSSLERKDRAWLASQFTTRPGMNRPGMGLAHGLWLKSAPADVHSPPAHADVKAVGQLVSEATHVIEGEIRLYPMTRLGDCNDTARIR